MEENSDLQFNHYSKLTKNSSAKIKSEGKEGSILSILGSNFQVCFSINFVLIDLIEGVLFRAQYLGSTQLICEGQSTKSTRMIQAEEAVSRIKV
jgi:hypothetical protein